MPKDESRSTKNYTTDGGDTLVIGGSLIFEDGAEIVNMPMAEAIQDSEAKTVHELVRDFNALLQTLRAAGMMHAVGETKLTTDED